MVKGLPSNKIFQDLSIKFLLLSFDQLYQIDEQQGLHLEYHDDENYDFWTENQESIYSILIILFQSIENFLKKEICLESPLLILSTPPSKWKNKHFNDLLIYGFDDLLKIYSELRNVEFDEAIKAALSKIKSTRNTIVHGVYKDLIFPKEIITFTNIFLKEIWGCQWLKDIRPFIPYEWETCSETIMIWKIVCILEKYPGKNKTCFLLGVKTQDLYICPMCHYYNEKLLITNECDYSYFIRKNGKKYLFCPICENSYVLSNKKCQNSDCNDKLIYSKDDFGYFCLNCEVFLDD